MPSWKKVIVSGSAAHLLNVTASSVLITGSNNTSLLQVSSPSAPSTLFVSGSGNVGIGTTTPQKELDVNGSVRLGTIFKNGGSSNLSFLSDGFGAVTLNIGGAIIGTLYDSTPNFNEIRTSNNQNLSINARGSGSLFLQTADTTRLTITGSNVGIGTTAPSASLHVQGNLQISTGSLYTYGQNTDIDSGSIRTVMSVSTGSYRAAFFDYVLNKSTNARAGIVFSVWNGTSVEWNDVSTNDIGNTTEVNLSVGLSGADVVLYASSSTNDWSVKALARML